MRSHTKCFFSLFHSFINSKIQSVFRFSLSESAIIIITNTIWAKTPNYVVVVVVVVVVVIVVVVVCYYCVFLCVFIHSFIFQLFSLHRVINV